LRYSAWRTWRACRPWKRSRPLTIFRTMNDRKNCPWGRTAVCRTRIRRRFSRH